MQDPLEKPESTLTWLRWVWALCLASIAVMFLFAVSMNTTGANLNVRSNQFITLFLMVVMVGVGYFTRMQFYKRHWQGDAVTPKGYFHGNMILFAMFVVFALFTSTLIYQTGQVAPLLTTIVVPAVLLAINFPTGAPMQPYRAPL